MQYMFYKAEKFNQPIGSWDTSAVTEYAAHVLRSQEIQPADRLLGHLCSHRYAVHPRGGGAGDRAGIDLVTNSPPQQATYPRSTA